MSDFSLLRLLGLKNLSRLGLVLLLAVAAPFLPLSFGLQPGLVRAETVEEKDARAQQLYSEALDLWRVSKFAEAFEKLQEALQLFREAGNRSMEGTTLNGLGAVYLNTGKHEDAITYFQRALVIVREVDNRGGEGITLSNLGVVYQSTRKYQEAITYFQQALAIHREVDNRRMEGTTFNNLGLVYQNTGKYEEAINYFQQALAIHREVDNRRMEGTTLNNLGSVYQNTGKYEEAITYFQQALAIHKEVGNRSGEGNTLSNLGEVYRGLEKDEKAIAYYQQALAIRREIGDQAGEGTTLNGLGTVYQSTGKYKEAITYFQQALAISKEVGDRSGEGTTLNGLGTVYQSTGKYEEAITYFQQALAISKEVGNRSGEGTTLSNLGGVYQSTGKYEDAITYFQQALAISKEVGDRSGEGTTLNGLGLVYQSTGKYEDAIAYLQQSLAIHREVGNRLMKGTTLNNLGVVYQSIGKYEKAITYYQESLAIRQEVGNRSGEGSTLNNLGEVYRGLGKYQEAITYFQKALAISQEVGNRSGEGTTLNNLGGVSNNLERYKKATVYFQQALTIKQEVGDRSGEGTILNNLGYVLEKQNQPQLAIIFLKQSVNIYETIRADIKGLPTDQQESYTATVADTYRKLGDLLLQQNRILEAQQVLDLLKVQELEDYLQNVRGEGDEKVVNLAPEIKIITEYAQLQDKAIANGKALSQLQEELKGIPLAQRSEAQLQRLKTLTNQREELVTLLTSFTKREDVQAWVQQLSLISQGRNVPLDQLKSISDDLQDIDQNAVLLYPLILEDRLELLLTTPNSPPIRRTVTVTREELNRTIVAYRQALKRRSPDVRKHGQKLYNWLIKPLENDLTTAEAETIIYAPDGQLRYIPLAALHDGEQWLVERFRVNNITARNLTDWNDEPSQELNILAGAFVNGNHSVQVGDRTFPFSGLKFAGREVEILASTIPNTDKLVDEAFNKDTFEDNMDTYTVLHFATHAALVPGKPEESFILFGSGETVSLKEVDEKWSINNVDLVVLSACQTGLGGELGEDGREILGFGYLMQDAGAKAAIASLWSVDDGGTQTLMNAFYAALATQKYSKAEALRQAQIALINGEYNSLGNDSRSIIEIRARFEEGLEAPTQNRLAHPYYWGPFILIGNGL